MKKSITSLVFLFLLLGSVGAASALPGIRIAPGLGLGSVADKAYGSDTAVLGEVIGYMSVAGILKLDLGIMLPLENSDMLQIRPGIRLATPLVYLRGAIPFSLVDGPGMGFLVGAGKQFSLAPGVALFAEVDGTWFKDVESDLGFEGYVGVEIGF